MLTGSDGRSDIEGGIVDASGFSIALSSAILLDLVDSDSPKLLQSMAL